MDIYGEEVCARGYGIILCKGPASLAPGRGKAAPPPPSGVFEYILMHFDAIWCKWDMSRILGNEWKGLWEILWIYFLI